MCDWRQQLSEATFTTHVSHNTRKQVECGIFKRTMLQSRRVVQQLPLGVRFNFAMSFVFSLRAAINVKRDSGRSICSSFSLPQFSFSHSTWFINSIPSSAFVRAQQRDASYVRCVCLLTKKRHRCRDSTSNFPTLAPFSETGLSWQTFRLSTH